MPDQVYDVDAAFFWNKARKVYIFKGNCIYFDNYKHWKMVYPFSRVEKFVLDLHYQNGRSYSDSIITHFDLIRSAMKIRSIGG